jgi:heat shock protein HslJ
VTRTLASLRHAVLFGLALGLVVAACGPGAASSPSPSGPPAGSVPTLEGTSWIVLSVNGRSPVPGAVPTIQFSASRVSGTGGCNQIGGEYRLDPATGAFAVDQLSSTVMGCLRAGVGEYESAFLTALSSATRAALDGSGQLQLDGPASRISLVTLEHPAVP